MPADKRRCTMYATLAILVLAGVVGGYVESRYWQRYWQRADDEREALFRQLRLRLGLPVR